MAGVGEVASIVSLVSLGIQVFDGCVKGFVLLSAALDIGGRAEFLGCKLDWEHYRLWTWARHVGLFNEPPELNVPNPPLVQRTLANLEKLLTDAQLLQEHYRLDIAATDEEIRQVNASKRVVGRLLDKRKPHLLDDTARVFSRRNQPWKKLRWGVIDADRFSLLIEDIGSLNMRLQSVLHPVDQTANAREGDAAMRNIIAQGPNKSVLDAITGALETVDPAIGASARLRRTGLQLDLIRSPSVASSITLTANLTPPIGSSSHRKASPSFTKALRKDIGQLSLYRGHNSPTATRELARYAGQPIVLEWKDVSYAHEAKLKYRIAAVASFLAAMEDPTFHSLHCLGFVKSPRSDRYAYLFSLPSTDWTCMRSLADLVDTPGLKPSLNLRLQTASAVAETVLQLHTAGWLHKSVRPDNVLFFNNQHADWNDENTMSSVYLGGYEAARADNPLESTEAPSTQAQTELYRHPRSLGTGRAFCTKRFDLYSLGCVFLEIGFWMPFRSILWQHCRIRSTDDMSIPDWNTYQDQKSNEDFYAILEAKQALLDRRGHRSVHADLQFHMGKAYTSMVMDCLTAAEGPISEEYDDSVEIQEATVATLRALLSVA